MKRFSVDFKSQEAVRKGLNKSLYWGSGVILLFLLAGSLLLMGLLEIPGLPFVYTGRGLKKLGEAIGVAAVVVAALAWSSWLLRYFLTYTKEFLSSDWKQGAVAGFKYLRLYHGLAGTAAVILACLHGYIMYYRGWEMDFENLTGLAALIAMGAVALGGITLKILGHYFPSARPWLRSWHFWATLVFGCFFCIHALE